MRARSSLGPGHRVESAPPAPRPARAHRTIPEPITRSGSVRVVQRHGLARGHPALRLRRTPRPGRRRPGRTVQGTAGPWALHWASARRPAPTAVRSRSGGPSTQADVWSDQVVRHRPPRAVPTVTRRAGTSTAVTKRRRPSVPWPMPRRWPTVTSSTAVTAPRSAPVSWSTRRPGWRSTRSPRKPARPSSERMKQTSWLSGLAAVRSPERAASWPHLVLGQLPHREEGPGQLVLAQHGQHIGLVLGRVGSPEQTPGAVRVPGPSGVVAGRHRVEPERVGPLEQAVELEVAVALDARVGGPARGVAGDVRLDHMGLEVGGEVEDVVDDAELVGHPSGVVHVGHRAAARVGVAAPQLEGGTDHIGRSRSDSASSAAATDESTPPDMATRTRTGTSFAGVRRRRGTSGQRMVHILVGGGDTQREADPRRGLGRPSPMAASTWLGSTAPLEQAAPAEAAMPTSSSRTTSGLGLDAVDTQMEDAGHPPVPVTGLRRARHRARSPSASRSRSAATRADRRRPPGHGRRQGGGHGRRRRPRWASRCADRAPARRRQHAGRTRAAVPHDQGPAALRAAELVGADRHQVGRCGHRGRRRATARPGPRRCGGRPPVTATRTISATSSSGWMVPTSLLTAMTDTRPTSARQASASASRSSDRRPGSAPPGARPRSGGPAPGRPAARRGAPWPSTPPPVAPGRSAVRHRLPPAVDGEVVGLGAARRQHHFARPDAQQFGDPVAGVVEGDPGPPRLGMGARRIGEVDRSGQGSMASNASGRSGVVAAWSR